jgi:F420-non-reducing hydrogenase iron-sulfur subunit
MVQTEEFTPKIIAFMCNWCAYGAADLAGVSRMQYPPNIRPVRVMCSATVSPHHILRALQSGADGILVGG